MWYRDHLSISVQREPKGKVGARIPVNPEGLVLELTPERSRPARKIRELRFVCSKIVCSKEAPMLIRYTITNSKRLGGKSM